MKTRFTTLDICAALTEINTKLVGMRLANVYDVNNKTYLLKLAKPDSKAVLLLESGIRLHISEFDWPKNMMPSGFSMKLRKHLKGRRLVSAKQLGIDRIVDMQFGSEDAAFHLILELYDRGNIVLTDHEYTILNILRYRKDKAQSSKDGDAPSGEDNSDVRFAVHETYPLQAAKQRENFDDLRSKLEEILKKSKNDDILKRILNPHLPYGAPCIDHCLLTEGFPSGVKIGKDFNVEDNLEQLFSGLKKGDMLLDKLLVESCGGYVIQKNEKKADGTLVHTNVEFHPYLFKQHEEAPTVRYDSFNKAVDEFFGSLESQKADMKILQQEKSAHKKLDNIKKDHEKRLASLEKEQETDVHKAQLIEENLTLVEQAIRVVRTAIANQIDWDEIASLIKDAQESGDQVAMSISKLNLKSNEFTMALHEPYEESSSDDDESSSEESQQPKTKSKKPKPVKVDIDIDLSAYGNAKRYYNKKRQASHKQQKIIDASEKALKSAEKKTTQTLKEAATIHNIQKARKTFWFEKFIWFISSENYLVIGGRDAQQNEILVKKYLSGADVYVHADLHGATSCIIKNPSSGEIPPKTLNEAGTMAICHSAAWSAKVITSAWWVHSHQVSKTAPSGEYLTTGSFLIRGKKNYLPPSYLVYGFGIMFKVDETCIHKHLDERKVMGQDLEQEVDTASITTESLSSELENELEIASDDEEDSENKDEEDGESSGTKISESQDNKNLEDSKLDLEQEHGDSRPTQPIEDPASSDSEEDNEMAFPETNVKVNFQPSTDSLDLTAKGDGEPADEPYVVYLGDAEPVVVQKRDDKNERRKSAKQKREAKKAARMKTEQDDMDGEGSAGVSEGGKKFEYENLQAPPKRGQKNKMKKIKTKYKDQDEEERAIKMELLQQSQSQKARDRKAKKNKSAAAQQQQKQNETAKRERRTQHQKPKPKPENEYDSDEERAKVLQNEHLTAESADILNSLTGCPLQDDILLFAIPVCAPYNTMHSYKFKVKLTPGNTKKGKGAKTALNLFQNLRETTSQEKDHLRSIKDHDLARNMPGKVKVSSTNLQLQRKKK